MSEREILKRKDDERRERVYADMGNGGDGFEEKKIVKGGDMEVKITATVSVSAGEVGEDDFFAITDDTCRPGGRKQW